MNCFVVPEMNKACISIMQEVNNLS